MPRLTPEELEAEERQGAKDLEEDLGTLSCFAAGEIDRVIRHQKEPPYEYLGLLKQRLDSWIPRVEQGGSRSLADSKTMVAVAMALPEKRDGTGLKQVVAQAREMIGRLAIILENDGGRGTRRDEEMLRNVMKFCVDLSRRLRSAGYPPDMQDYLARRREERRG